MLFVAIDGKCAGLLGVIDSIKNSAREAVAEMRRRGVEIVMLTGDNRTTADVVARQLGIDKVVADVWPEQKNETIRQLQSEGKIVAMAGDGINDAPALALADVGIAMGGPGATASSEAADAVITSATIGAVATAVAIGRRSLGIATQSVLAGMGLSFVAMGFAAAGLLPPVAGALLQEGIDVAVILNALRARTG